MKKVDLVIKCKYRVISIPFPEIKKLDMFTSGYDSEYELFDTIRELLNLKIKDNEFREMYVLYWYKPRNNKYKYDTVSKILPIKYSYDNYEMDNLKEVYAKYYKDDPRRIKNTEDGIRYINHDAIKNYIAGYKNITNNEIDMAVNAFFDKGSYKTYRDAYFLLKANGYDVKIIKHNRDNNLTRKIDMHDYQSEEVYLDSMIRYGRQGEEEKDKVVEELSLYDDDMLKDISGNNSLFDYQEENDMSDDRKNEGNNLEDITNMSLKELMNLVEEYKTRFDVDHRNQGPKR